MKDMTKGSITGHLLHMASFLAISMLFQTLYYLVDLYFVSGISKEAIAGVSMAGNLMMAVLALTQTLGVGTTSLISQAAGRKDQQDAQLIFNQSFILSLMVGGAVVVLGFAFRMTYCESLSPDAATVQAGADYLLWFIPALGLQFALISMAAALRGTGVIKPTTVVQVMTVLLNMILAPILIAGWVTHRPMGTLGAGLASFIALIAGVIFLTFSFIKLEAFVSFDPKLWTPRLDVWKRMISIGLPAGGEFAVLSVYSAVVYWIIRGFGSGAQAGFGIGQRVVQSLFLPVIAVAFAASPIAGQNFGARQPDRVRETFRVAAYIASSVMILITLLCHVSPESVIRLFSKEPQVVEYGSEYLKIASYGFLASALVFTSSGMFQALGNTWPSLASSVSRLVLFSVPAIFMASKGGFALRDIWYISVAVGALQAVANILLLRREFTRKLNFKPV